MAVMDPEHLHTRAELSSDAGGGGEDSHRSLPRLISSVLDANPNPDQEGGPEMTPPVVLSSSTFLSSSWFPVIG